MIPVKVLAVRYLQNAALSQALGTDRKCLAMVTTDCDDATFIALDAATKAAIGRLWREHYYLADTHTAVAFHVAAQKKRSGVPMVVLSTASPFKFPRSVLEALGRTAPENDFEAMQQLEAATGHAAPASLAALRQKAERFDTVIDPAQIAEVALGYQA